MDEGRVSKYRRQRGNGNGGTQTGEKVRRKLCGDIVCCSIESACPNLELFIASIEEEHNAHVVKIPVLNARKQFLAAPISSPSHASWLSYEETRGATGSVNGRIPSYRPPYTARYTC